MRHEPYQIIALFRAIPDSRTPPFSTPPTTTKPTVTLLFVQGAFCALLLTRSEALLRFRDMIRASIHKDPAARVLRDLVQGGFAPPKPP